MNQKYINLILAALIVVALGVAIFGGKNTTVERIVEKTKETLSGVSNVDILQLNNLIFNRQVRTGNEILVIEGASITLEQGQNQVRWNNDTGREVVAFGDVIFPIGQTASSSYFLSVLATTTDTIGEQFDLNQTAAPTEAQAGDSFFVRGFTIATGTPASGNTASSTAALVSDDVLNNVSLRIPAGDNLIMYLQAQSDNSCIVSGMCGGATSSDRNLNPSFRFLFTSTTTADTGR